MPHHHLCECSRCRAPSQRGPQRPRGRRGGQHQGGFDDPIHGWIDGRPVTAAFGWGSKEGRTELVDGHVDLSSFWGRSDRNHYGSGRGPNNNVKERFGYTGPGT